MERRENLKEFNINKIGCFDFFLYLLLLEKKIINDHKWKFFYEIFVQDSRRFVL